MFGISISEVIGFIAILFILQATGMLHPLLNTLRVVRGQEPLETPVTPPNENDLNLSYLLLGVSPSASMEEVERAYRREAKAFHPDLGGNDTRMRALNEAYSMIKKARRTKARR